MSTMASKACGECLRSSTRRVRAKTRKAAAGKMNAFTKTSHGRLRRKPC